MVPLIAPHSGGMGDTRSQSFTGGSITKLLAGLCDNVLSSARRKQQHMDAVRPDGARRALKRCAYEALLARLFQDAPTKANSSLASASPPRNKLLMISFDLRVGGCEREADRLEELLDKLGDGRGCGLGELDSVLELLVQLAYSVPADPVSFSRDSFQRERVVCRRPLLDGYLSKDLQRLEARTWALVCSEEWACQGAGSRALGMMDAQPGAGLLLLSRGFQGEERFSRDTRTTLFGALLHARTTDLDVRLRLPSVPNSAEQSGLTIRVPPYFDHFEDEGFQSASNLSPDSQSEPSPSPELDVWEASLSVQSGGRRCWEHVGCPPGKKEEVYLSEGGRETFDHFYRFCESHVRVVSCATTSPPPPVPLHTQTQLVADLLNVLIGVASATFPLNQMCVQFEVSPGVCVSGASPESVSRLLKELAQYGTHYLRLSRFSMQSSHKNGLVFQAFTWGLRRYLRYYQACVLSTPPSLSLLAFGFLFRKLGRQLRYLSELCCVDGSAGKGEDSFPTGVKLLTYLYNEAQSNCSNENYPVLLSLLKSSCEPYTRFVSDWVYSGVFRDVYKEFMIQVNEDYLNCRDKSFWVQGYTLISHDVKECVPVFLRHIANDVYVCGKTINLLKICNPQHYICGPELPVPQIAITFSLQEVEETERECAVYKCRMEGIAKHSTISREEQASCAQRVRQELINQVRESTLQTLESIRERQMSQRLIIDAKKRERFKEVKQQLEQQLRNAARWKEEQEGLVLAEELRVKNLQNLEEQLERKAREELIGLYSTLSVEAAQREQRAIWRVKRLQLHKDRVQFLMEDQQKVVEVPCSVWDTASSPTSLRQTSDPRSLSGEIRLETAFQEHDPVLNQHHSLSEEMSTQTSLNSVASSVACPDMVRVQAVPQITGHDVSLTHNSTDKMSHSDSHKFIPGCAGSGGELSRPPLQGKVHGPSSEITLTVGCAVLGQEPFRPPLPGSGHGHSSETSVTVGCVVLAEEPSKPPLPGSGHGHSSESTLTVGCVVPGEEPTRSLPGSGHGQSSDSTLTVGCVVPGEEPSRSPLPGSGHGHSSDSTLTVGCVVPGEEPSRSPLPGSEHGHSSDSTLTVGCAVSGDEPSRPLPGSGHGHSSDSTLTVGCVVSGEEPSRPSIPGSEHGHSSDSTLTVGCVVLGEEPSRPSLPGSGHGHSSDSTLTVGCVVPGEEPSRPSLPGSEHGHSSDSTLTVGCVVSGEEPSRPSLPGSGHGHSSDSTLILGCVVSGEEPSRPSLPGSGHGHSSDSTLTVGCVVSGEEPSRPSLPGSGHGHSSDSTLTVGCVVSGEEPSRPSLPGSGHGHSSDSTLTVGCVMPEISHRSPISAAEAHSSQLTLETRPLIPDTCEGASASDSRLFSGDDSEQKYLMSLAAQYEGELYQHYYGHFTSAPDSQLLQQVTCAPSATLDSHTPVRSASALQLSEMVSLPVLMKHSITTPLITHVSLVNKAVVDYFFVELGVERHFNALRQYLLMEDGEFAQSLSDLLFEKLGSGQTPSELLTPLVLNSILSKALQYSLDGDSKLAGNFTFALRFLPERFHPHAPDVLHCLELRYKVDWPLNIVITESCMNKYNRLFSFLLQLKHMVWTLCDIWFQLKRAALVQGASCSTQFRQLQLYRHEMQHFVKVIQGYIANQILQVSWSEFTQRLAHANDVDAIHRTHADYLNRAIFRGLLTEKAAPVMNIIHSIFSLILKFRAQLIAQPWDVQQGEAVHPSFIAMQQSYNTFKYYSHFLFKVVTKLVNRGYQPHLEDFLLRINFNNYYKDS